jgi:hypothetical protein
MMKRGGIKKKLIFRIEMWRRDLGESVGDKETK